MNSTLYELDYSSPDTNPFYALYRYLLTKRDTLLLKQMDSSESSRTSLIDYGLMMYLINQEPGSKSSIEQINFQQYQVH